MRTFARLSLVCALALQAGSTHAQQPVAAMQRLVASQGEARSRRDCEAEFRSFKSRNTLRPSERRAALARCRQEVRPPQGPIARSAPATQDR